CRGLRRAIRLRIVREQVIGEPEGPVRLVPRWRNRDRLQLRSRSFKGSRGESGLAGGGVHLIRRFLPIDEEESEEGDGLIDDGSKLDVVSSHRVLKDVVGAPLAFPEE